VKKLLELVINDLSVSGVSVTTLKVALNGFQMDINFNK